MNQQSELVNGLGRPVARSSGPTVPSGCSRAGGSHRTTSSTVQASSIATATGRVQDTTRAGQRLRARLGWTRDGSPGIFGWSGG